MSGLVHEHGRLDPYSLLGMQPINVSQHLVLLTDLPTGRSAANPPHVAAAVHRRGSDGRTRGRYIDPAPRTMQAASGMSD